MASLLALATPATGQVLRGTVVDSASGQPMAGVHVTALNVRGVTVGDTVTGGSGTFGFHLPVIGKYRVRAVRIGYASSITEPIAVGTKFQSSIRLTLRPNAVPLDTLTVVPESVATERRISWLARVGFYDRRRKGWGSFVTRDEIEQKDPIVVADLLKGMPGVRVACTSVRDCLILTRAATTMFIGKVCGPAVVLDGVTVAGNLEDINPFNLEAVEVYPSPAGVPVQYSGYLSPCGAILLWSRRW